MMGCGIIKGMRVLLFCTLVLGLCTASAHALTYQLVDFSTYHNYRLQNIDSGYPTGSITLGGVPFNIPNSGNNIWSAHDNSDGVPRFVDVNVWVSGVKEVHTLINTVWGQLGPTAYASIEFFGSNGAYYKKDLIGNLDIRDHYNGVYINSINNTTTTNVLSLASSRRLDKQQIELPAEFENQVLSRIRISDCGRYNFQRIFVAGITLATADTVSPAPFDLAIAPQDITTNPGSPIMSGNAVTVMSTVHNTSDTDGTCDVHLNATDGINVVDLGTTTGVSVPAHSTATVSVTHNTGGQNGTFKYTANIINPSTPETTTANNTAVSSGVVITNVIPVYYGFNAYYAGGLILVGFSDDTNYSIANLDASGTIVSTGKLNKAGRATPSVGSLQHFKVESDKPLFVYLGYDCCSFGGSFFFPSVDGANRVGTDYIVSIPVLSGTNEFVIWAYDDADVTISRPDTTNPNKMLPVVGPFRLAKNTRWETTGSPLASGSLYYVHSEPPASNPASSARIALECNTGNGQAAIPSSNGRDMGKEFLFKTHNWQTGAIAVFAYEDTTVTCTRLSDNSVFFNQQISKGQTYFRTGCGRQAYRITSTGNVAVWAGDAEGGNSIADMGDDITINQGNGGKEFYLHSQTQGAKIFCAYDGTVVSVTDVGGNTTTTYNRDKDGFIDIAPWKVLHIVATNPVMVQTLGGNGFNDWGNALNPVFGLDSGCAFPPVPNAGPDIIVVRGRSTDFDAAGSTGNIITYQWDFNGDGVPDSTSSKAAYTFDTVTPPGQPVVVKLTVSDDKGCQASDTVLVTVRDPIPFDLAVSSSDLTASPASPLKGGTPVHISATIRNISDFDGTCDVHFTASDGANIYDLGTANAPVAGQSSTAVSVDHTTAGLNGTFTYTAAIVSGNPTESSTANNNASISGVVIDSTAPDAVITFGPAQSAVVNPNPSFTWSGSDNFAAPANLVYAYKLSSEDWSAYSSETSHSFTGLAAGVYTFSIKAKDPAGNEGTPIERSFTVDDTAPTVSAVSPADGAADVNTGTVITAIFSKDMDPGTILASTFTLKDDAGNSAAGSVTYDAATRTAKYEPSSALVCGAVYTAAITTGAKDSIGNAVAANYNWSFSTPAIGINGRAVETKKFKLTWDTTVPDHVLQIVYKPFSRTQNLCGSWTWEFTGEAHPLVNANSRGTWSASVVGDAPNQAVQVVTETVDETKIPVRTEYYIESDSPWIYVTRTFGFGQVPSAYTVWSPWWNPFDMRLMPSYQFNRYVYRSTTGQLVTGAPEGSGYLHNDWDRTWAALQSPSLQLQVLMESAPQNPVIGLWTDYDGNSNASFMFAKVGPPAGGQFTSDLTMKLGYYFSVGVPGADKPDLLIRRSGDADTAYALADIYQTAPGIYQTVSRSSLIGSPASFDVMVRNNGQSARSFVVKAAESGGENWASSYAVNGADVKSDIFGGGYQTISLAPGESEVITVTMTPGESVPEGNNMSTLFEVFLDQSDTAVRDSVKAVTTAIVLDTTVPQTSITSGPADNSSGCSDTVEFCWTGSDNVTLGSDLQYSWKLDDAQDWSTPSSETCHQFAGLADGAHTFAVRAVDASGNADDTPEVRHFNLDLTNPEISNITVLADITQVKISWKTNKPTTSQVAYGSDQYTSATTLDERLVTDHSATITGLSIAGTYHFCAKAKDACGRDLQSDDQVFTTLPDTTAPGTQIIAGPAEGSEICADSTRFCWSGSDNVTPTAGLTYSYKMDNAAWSAVAPDTCVDLTALKEGTHTFSIRAVDTSGNIDATPAVRTFKVSLSAPVITNVTATAQPISATIVWGTDKPATSQVIYSIDTSYSQATQLNSALITGHNVTLTALGAATTYHYKVKSKDSCGRESISADFTFTTSPDSALPDTVIISGPGEGSTVCDSSVMFNLSGSDDTTHVSKLRYACRVDGGSWTEFTSNTAATLDALAAGTHTFEAAAKDLFDKVDATPVTRHFIVNLDAPVVTAVSSSPSRGDAAIIWTTDEPSTSLVEFGLDKNYGSSTTLNSNPAISHSVAVTGLAASTTYHYRVKSKDVCGRESMSEDFTFITQADDGTPDTWVAASNPSEGGSSCSTTVNLSWAGKDDVTPGTNLLFSWKMDSTQWSAYTSEASHQFTGLSEGAHIFYVRAKDASGNIDPTPALRHFNVDLSSPTASNIAASSEATRAIMTWLTNKPATSLVEYGPTSSYGSATTIDRSLVNSHSVSISGLSPETTYYYRIRSKDFCEREVISDGFTFRTSADTNVPDTRIVSGPNEGGKACDSNVEICWTGSDDATSAAALQYSYKMDDSIWSDWIADTCHTFDGLAAGLHTLQVKAKDTADNIDATPAVRSFKVDVSTPTISSVLIVPRQSSATVSWITSEPATSQLEYGAITNYGSKTGIDFNMVTSHKMTISGLTPETAYHVRALSSDGCREVTGDDNTFTTLKILPPNLIPMGVMTPPSTSATADLQITYTVKNSEPGDAPMAWMDGFYLSTDDKFDPDVDIPLGQFPSSGALIGLFSYTQTQNLKMPRVAPGVYYVLLKVDDGDIIGETTKDDNLYAQAINVTLVRQLTVTPDIIWMQLNPTSPVTGQLDISNLGINDLTDLKATVTGASANIDVKLDVPSTLEALTGKKVAYTLTASDESVLQNSPKIEISSGNVSASATLNLYVIPRQPKLVANPGYLESGMLRGKQSIVECEVTNMGSVPANDVKVKIPSVGWMTLVSPDNLGSIAPGEKVKVTLRLNPSSAQALGPYDGNIALAGSNGGASINFKFTCISDGVGTLKVTCQDEFSFFADDHPNVADAVITLTNVMDGTKIFEAMTDSTGTYTKAGIKEGHYRLEVKAYKHATYNATIEIAAGETKEIAAFMQRQLVSYTWNVEPIQLEDKYKISIEAVFEAHVPAPVVTIDPPYSLVPIFEGKTTEIDYTITNHGLVAAQGVTLDFGDNDTYEVVPLIRDIGVLPAETSIVVPVLYRAKKDGPIELPQMAKAAQEEYEARMAVARLGPSGAVPITGALMGSDPHVMEGSGDDPMKKCDLIIKGDIFYYYKCVDNQWQKIPIDSTPLYILKEIYDIAKCGFDALACAGALSSGAAPVAAVKCPDAVRCMFKYLCEVISAYGGTPCCYCKMVSSLLGDTGEMGDALDCLPKPKLNLSLPPRVVDGPGWGIGLNLPSNGFDVNVGSPWDIGEGIPGPCQGVPKPATADIKAAGTTGDGTDISKYGGKEVRCKIRCY